MADVATDGIEFSVPEIGPEELIYVETVRQATRRLGYRAPAPDDLDQAIQILREVSQFDVEVPTVSNRREVEMLKTGVKRLLTWYMRYLAVELNNFSAATARVSEVLAHRSEKLETNADELAARVGALEERMKRLEVTEAGAVPKRPDAREQKTSSGGSSSRGASSSAGQGAPGGKSEGQAGQAGHQERRTNTSRKTNGKQ
jgi:cell division protein FtsB